MSAPQARGGTLSTLDIADLIQDLYEHEFTGKLTLTRRGSERRLWMQAGNIVFASSTDRDDRLGELLLCQGHLSLRQFRLASAAVAPGKRLGTVLVEQGVLSPKELVRAVVEHTREIVCGVLQWTDGQYALVPGIDSTETITLKMSTPDLILEGLRRVQSWSRIERALGGPEARYERNPDYEQVIGRMTLSLERLEILTNLHAARGLETICADARLTDIEVCRTLWAFRVVGAVRRTDAPTPRGPEDDEGLDVVLGEE